MKKSYDIINQIFADKKCELYTSKDEYNLMHNANRNTFYFKASCGHDNSVTLTNFIQKGSGLICKECMKNQVSNKLVEYQKQNDMPASKGHVQETMVFNLLNDLLSKEFNIQKTNEGCTADFIIKSKEIKDSKWLGVQLKTTQGICHNLYSFKLHKNKYENLLIICYCICDNLMWLIPFENISHIKGNLNIGLTDKSIYNKFKINKLNIFERINEYFEIMNLNNLESFTIPINICQQNEIKYRNIMQKYCFFLNFKKPEIEQSFYDFTINGKRIQEKVTYKRKDRDNTYIAFMYRGRSNEERRPYLLGMNDYYWFHIPDTDIFYIFPEIELFNNSYIQVLNEEKKCKLFLNLKIDNKDAWYFKYQYNYKILDKDFEPKVFGSSPN